MLYGMMSCQTITGPAFAPPTTAEQLSNARGVSGAWRKTTVKTKHQNPWSTGCVQVGGPAACCNCGRGACWEARGTPTRAARARLGGVGQGAKSNTQPKIKEDLSKATFSQKHFAFDKSAFSGGKPAHYKSLFSFVMIHAFVVVCGTACQKWKLSLKCLFLFAFTFRFVRGVQLSSSETGTAEFKPKNLPILNFKQSELINSF